VKIKVAIHKGYRKFFYPFFKEYERHLRKAFFGYAKFFFPRFNAFRIFGIPSGVQSISGEVLVSSAREDQKLESALGHIAILKNGFASLVAATLTEEGKLVPEFTEQFTMKQIYNHSLFRFRFKRCLPSIPHFEGSVGSLSIDGHWNYYHWLFDALPKIHLMRKKGISPDKYYGDDTKSFQKESLRLLGIHEKDLISPHKHPVISASSLVVTSFPCMSAISHWTCEFLQKSFLPHSKPQNAKKLFISRKNASYRRILNEEELLPFLQREGFTIIQPETLSFTEQISLFQSAEVILAPHGAGLANLVFSKPGTKLIEIFPPRFTCTCYEALAKLIGVEYFSLHGIDDKITYSSECEGYDHILLDVEKLKRLWGEQAY